MIQRCQDPRLTDKFSRQGLGDAELLLVQTPPQMEAIFFEDRKKEIITEQKYPRILTFSSLSGLVDWMNLVQERFNKILHSIFFTTAKIVKW